MHSCPCLGALLGLVLLLTSVAPGQAAIVDASFDVADVDICYLPFYPSVYQSGAVLSLINDEPIFFHAGRCMNNNLCNGTNIVPCCAPDQCDPVLLQRLPTAPTDCACPSAPGYVCFDGSNPIVVGDGDEYQHVPPATSIFFELAFNQSCHNMLFETNSYRGAWSLRLAPADSPALARGSAYHVGLNLGTNQIALCADPLDGDPDLYGSGIPNTLGIYATHLAADGWPRIRGNVQGSGTVRITVTEVMHPTGLVPLIDPAGLRLSWNLGTMTANCPSASSGTMQPLRYTKQNTPFLPIFLPPTADPLYDWTQYMSTLVEVDATKLNPNQISIFLPIETETLFSSNPVFGNVELCEWDFSEYRNFNDTPISNGTVTFRRENSTRCDRAALSGLASATAQRITNFKQDYDILVANAKIWSSSGVTASLLWPKCKRFADQFVVTNEYIVGNTTQCFAEPNTPEFFSDPCCNSDLTWAGICEPRSVKANSFGGNELLIASQCATPACSTQVATSLAAVTARIAASECGTEAVRSQVAVLDPIGGGSGLVQGVCFDAFLSGTDEELVDCLTQPDVVSEAYRQELYSLWGVTEQQANATGFRTLLLQQYNTSGCYQPGITAYSTDDRLVTRNASLDNNPGACNATLACNWGQDLKTNDSCVNSYRGPGMCAACDATGYCEEISTTAACLVRQVQSNIVGLEDYCNIFGGTYYRDGPVCAMALTQPSNAGNYVNCINQALCPNQDICPFQFCYYPGYTAVTCDCNSPSAPPACLFGLPVQYIGLGPTKICWIPTIFINVEDCLTIGGTYYPGGEWSSGELDSKAACETYGGKCSFNNPLFNVYFNETECATQGPGGSCSVTNCPAPCNSTTCKSTIGCNDQILNPSSDIASAIIDYTAYGSNFVLCVNGADPVPNLGCVWNLDTTDGVTPGASAYVVFGGKLVLRPGFTNQTQCESVGRCQEPNFAPGVTTPKNESQCAVAGGTYIRPFQWGNGTWTDAPNFTRGQWVPREFRAGIFHPTTFLNRSGFAQDFYAIQSRQQARVANQTALCKNGQLLDLVNTLACDCSAPRIFDPVCYSSPQLQLALLGRACSNVPNNFVFSGNQGFITVNNGATFSPPCVDLIASVVPYTLFRLSGDTVFTSVFVSAISAGPYENDHEITVGTLFGNGIQINIGDGSLTGSFNVCLAIDRERIALPHRFKVPDFASVDASFKLSTFRAKEFVGCTVSQDFICCPQVPTQGLSYIFPIMRVSKPQDELLADTLTKSQRNCFLAAIVIYIVLWAFVTFRLFNYVLFIIIRATKYDYTNLLLLGLVLLFLFLALGLRWTYFLLTYRGQLVGSPLVGDIIYAELPFYFFLTIFTLIVAWWIELHHWANTARNSFLRRMRWVLIGVNVFLYAFFIAVIIAYAVTSRKTSQTFSVCSAETSNSAAAAKTLAKVYKTTISAIAAVLAIGFIIYGAMIVRVVSSGLNVHVRSVVSFTLLAITCAVGLLVQCGVLLYTTYAGKVNTVAALVVLIVAEIIPGGVLAITLRQPTQHKEFLKDILWCFYAPDAQSGTTSSRFTPGRSASGTGRSASGTEKEESRF